jgi:hypothetical protein
VRVEHVGEPLGPGGSGNSSAGGAGAARTTRYPNSGDGLQLPQAKSSAPTLVAFGSKTEA